MLARDRESRPPGLENLAGISQLGTSCSTLFSQNYLPSVAGSARTLTKNTEISYNDVVGG